MTSPGSSRPVSFFAVMGVVLSGCQVSGDSEFTEGVSDDAFQPVISVTVDNPQVIEGDGGYSTMSFAVTLSGASQSSFDIKFVTVNGTATAGSDYVFRKGSVTFNPGELQKNIDIQIIGDQLDEEDEELVLDVDGNTQIIINTPQATGMIGDDDDPVAVTIGDASVTEGNAGYRKLLFPITLNSVSGKPVLVDYATADDLATTPDDYVQASGQLTIDPGVTSSVITVRVRGDTTEEGDEDLVVNLLNEVNATLQDSAATGTIMNDDPVSGLQQRQSNLTCNAPDEPTTNTSIDTPQVFAGVGSFVHPVAMVQAPGDATQWYVVEQPGSVYRFDNDVTALGKAAFVDISSVVNSGPAEAGLLGIAFDPDYQTNRTVYLSYTATGPDSTYKLTSRLSRFQSLDNGLTLDPGTEVILLSQDQRYSNHNGGNIAFGPDGYLYMGLGDSGSGGDPGDRAQNTTNLFGAMLRIDVHTGSPYGIPNANPFSGNPLCSISTTGIDSADPCPEIYAWGFRNPWRWSFDTDTGVLWVADVGQNDYEEVDLVELGGNYGWRVQEGFHCYNPPSGCVTAGLVQPILEYDHAVGQSITGGYVYRGSQVPQLSGRYVFADYVAGKLFASVTQGGGNYDYELLADTDLFISSFAQDENGELYFLDYLGGTIRKITQFGGSSNDTIATNLSDTGCVDDIDPTQPAQALIPYDVNASFWSDGADKERLYAIPDGMTVDVDINGDWQFPIGTILVKNFRLSGILVESRHFMRHSNGKWAGYTYEWNDDQTEATRVIGGKTKDINGQSWTFPSETQCMTCHTSVSGFSLGPEHAQLNRDYRYPSTGITANQLFTADAIDVLTDPLGSAPENMPSLTGVAAGGYMLDFNMVATSSYSNQDSASGIAVEDNGASLVLTDNTWRKTDQLFTVTADTVLEFDYQSTAEGEVQGIGFDENNTWNDDTRIFQLYGTQNWAMAIADFKNYAGGGPVHYEIPVGQYYTGNDMYLVFANDYDAGAGTDGRFSNVRIREASIQGEPSMKDQVRSYLHVNCSGCHRPFGPTQSTMDLRFQTTWPAMNACDVPPALGELGLTDARIIAPGDSARSVLVNRMSRRDAYGMPPLGSNIADTAGVDLITTWIDSLTTCPQ